MNNTIIMIVSGVRRLFSNKKYLGLLVLVVLVSLISVHNSTSEYNNRMAGAREFQKLETLIFTNIPNYVHYSVFGIQVLFTPSPSFIFYGISPAMSMLHAKINSITDLKINDNAKIKTQSSSDYPLRFRFPLIVLLILSLFSIFIGVGAARYREFLKTAAGAYSSVKIYAIEFLSRYVFLILIYLVTHGISILYVITRSVDLTAISTKVIYKNIVVTLVMLLFFFFIGTIIPNLARSKSIVNTAVLSVWIVFVLVIPLIFNYINEKKSSTLPSVYELDNKKFGVITEFEKTAADKFGKFNKNNMETARKIAEGYYNNEFKQIMNLERQHRDLLLKKVEKQESLAALTPVTLYLGTCFEGSSCGDRSFIAFYDYLIDLQKKFLRFWIDRVYYNDPKVMVNFVKGDENIFKSVSRKPGNFGAGIFLNIGYILVLGIVSFLLFVRSTYRMKAKELSQLGKVDIDLKNDEIQYYTVRDNHFKNLLFNLFSGRSGELTRKGFNGKIQLNGLDISLEKSRQDFFFLGAPDTIPDDLRVKDFIKIFSRMNDIPAKEQKESLQSPLIKEIAGKKYSKLSIEKRFSVLISLLKPGNKQIYLIYDAAAGLPLECGLELLNEMENLIKRERVVIYLTTTLRADGRKAAPPDYYGRGIGWEYMIKAFREGEKHKNLE